MPLVLLTVLLASCISRQETVIIQATPHPAGVAPLPGQPLKATKVVLANKTSRIEGFFQVNPDCTVREGGTIRVTLQPSHGETRVYQDKDFPSYPLNNPRSACNKTRVQGTFLSYTPTPDYTGSDTVEIEIIDGQGVARKLSYAITVE